MDDPKIGATYRDWQAIADRRLELLKIVEKDMEWCPVCDGMYLSVKGKVLHANDCRLEEELSDGHGTSN